MTGPEKVSQYEQVLGSKSKVRQWVSANTGKAGREGGKRGRPEEAGGRRETKDLVP